MTGEHLLAGPFFMAQVIQPHSPLIYTAHTKLTHLGCPREAILRPERIYWRCCFCLLSSLKKTFFFFWPLDILRVIFNNFPLSLRCPSTPGVTSASHFFSLWNTHQLRLPRTPRHSNLAHHPEDKRQNPQTQREWKHGCVPESSMQFPSC